MVPDAQVLETLHVGPIVHEAVISRRESGISSHLRSQRSSFEVSPTASTTPNSTQDSISRFGSLGHESSYMRRFKPEVIESTLQHRGRNTAEQGLRSLPAEHEDDIIVLSPFQIASCRSHRTWVPQIVESVRRSRKSGDLTPALTFGDKTDVLVRVDTVLSRRRSPKATPTPPTSTPLEESTFNISEARRLGLPLPRRTYSSDSDFFFSSRKSPTIEAIVSPEKPVESSSRLVSDELTAQRSSDRISELTHKHRGSLLEFAATNAERQLREQALAAFPNNQVHHRVHHYLDMSETPPHSRPGSSSSSRYEVEAEVLYAENWELKELREHHERLEAVREQQRLKREARRKLQKQLDAHPWAIPESIPEDEYMTKSIDDLEAEEMPRDRPRVRPPMLGADIEFPRSDSPGGARFDVTQGPESLKKAMCYLSEQSEMSDASGGVGGLWIPKKEPSRSSCVWSRPSCTWSRPASRAPSNAGLWGGSCVDANSPTRGPTGIMTPRLEEEQSSLPKDTMSLFKQQHLPPSPPPSSSGMTSLDVCMENGINIEAEFDDTFITQVYNYMSLGYPAVARDFDAELSKVTGTPLADLRKDDDLPRACGYIRLGEETAAQSGVTEANCARWKALRMYVIEWARQQPNMAPVKPLDAGWAGARKGSWAL